MIKLNSSALYKDEESMASFYAGIVAETPNQRNAYRWTVESVNEYIRQLLKFWMKCLIMMWNYAIIIYALNSFV